MKVYAIILISLYCFFHKGEVVRESNVINLQHYSLKDKVDTLYFLSLKDRQYHNSQYEILCLCNSENEMYIQIKKDQKMFTRLNFPKPDEVKNFTISNVVNTDNGFKVYATWGGGCCFYERKFMFKFSEECFSLETVIQSSYNQELDEKKKVIKSIVPTISIKEFNIYDYIKNE